MVPLFLRSGYLIFRQNTENITKTDHLNNRFELVSACKLVANSSEYAEWRAEGGVLALGDYNLNSDVTRCISEGCDFQIGLTLLLIKSSNEKQLILEIEYDGRSVRYSQFIEKFTLFL